MQYSFTGFFLLDFPSGFRLLSIYVYFPSSKSLSFFFLTSTPVAGAAEYTDCIPEEKYPLPKNLLYMTQNNLRVSFQ